MKKRHSAIFLLALLLIFSPCFQDEANSNVVPKITKIVTFCKQFKFTKAQCAYTLATIEHETAYTFQPVREAYWLSELWRRNNLRYYPFYGRGQIQLTWLSNYLKMGNKLGLNLAANPDLLLQEDISLKVAFIGLRDGDFTGLKLSQFIINSLDYSYQARRSVNGLDKAGKISERAHFWLKRLTVY